MADEPKKAEVKKIGPGQYEVNGVTYYSRQKAHAVARKLNESNHWLNRKVT